MSRKASTDQKKKQRRRTPKGCGVGGVRARSDAALRSRKLKAQAARADRLKKAVSDEPMPPGFKPSWRAYLWACIRLLDAGKPCTQINLARELGISPQAVWKYLRRHPGVMAFVEQQLNAQNKHVMPLIVRRHALLAQQGSVASADFVAKVEGGYYLRVARPGGNEDEDSPEDSRYVTHVNILVPCPQLPNGGRMPVFGPQPATGLPAGVDLKDIPTVSVR